MNKNYRREALKVLAVSAPAVWGKPVVDSVVLPGHADVSCFICGGTLFPNQIVTMGNTGDGNDPPPGTTGTLLGVREDGDVLVDWNGWSGGHGGGVCDALIICPPGCTDNDGNSRRYHPCSEIIAFN